MQHLYESSVDSEACRVKYCGTGHLHHPREMEIDRSTSHKVRRQMTTSLLRSYISSLVISVHKIIKNRIGVRGMILVWAIPRLLLVVPPQNNNICFTLNNQGVSTH